MDINISITIDRRHINSALEFAAIFDKGADDALLLCYEEPQDCVHNADIVYLHQKLQAYALEEQRKLLLENTKYNKFSRRLHLYTWECSRDLFDVAKKQVNKLSGKPLLLLIYRQEVLDSLRPNSLSEIYDGSLANLFHRLIHVEMLTPQSVMLDSTACLVNKDEINNTLHIDVAKMFDVGKQSMCKGKPHYAEKIFVKAIQLLDTMQKDIYNSNTNNLFDDDEMELYEKTYALCLAWAALAQLVKGKNIPHKEITCEQEHIKEGKEEHAKECHTVLSNDCHKMLSYLERLLSPELPYYRFCKIPLSDECRVSALAVMMTELPKVWSSEECSAKKLQALLSINPDDHDSRAALVITYFLQGDIERALTESIKLKVLNVAFGEVAIAQITHFLGETHELLKQLEYLEEYIFKNISGAKLNNFYRL